MVFDGRIHPKDLINVFLASYLKIGGLQILRDGNLLLGQNLIAIISVYQSERVLTRIEFADTEPILLGIACCNADILISCIVAFVFCCTYIDI